MANISGWKKSSVTSAPDFEQIDEMKQSRNLTDAYRATEKANPDEIGEANRLSRKLGTDPEAVRKNLPAARHAANAPDLTKLEKESPVLSRQMQDPSFVALMKDDIDRSARIENVFRKKPELSLSRLGMKAWYSGTQSIADIANNVVAYYEKFDPENFNDQEEMMRGFTVTDRGRYNKKLGEFLGDGVDKKMAMAAALRWIRGTNMDEARKIAEDKDLQIPEELQDSSGIIEDVVGGLAGSTIGMLTTAVNPVLGTVTFGSQIGGSKYRELRKKGTDPRVASEAALISAIGQAPLESAGALLQLKSLGGVFTAVGNKLGIPKLLASSPVKEVAKDGWAVLGKDILKSLGISGAGEGLEEYLQNFPDMLADVYAENPDATVAEVAAIFLDRIPETAVSKETIHSALVGALSGIVMTGGGLSVSVPVQISRRNRAVKTQEMIESLAQSNSKLQERDEVAYKDFVKKVAEDTGIEQVFIQGDKLNQTLDQLGINKAEWLAKHDATVSDLQTAVSVGGDIALSSGALSELTTDDVMNQLIKEIKVASADSSINSLEADIEAEDQATVRLREIYEEEQIRKVKSEHITTLEENLKFHAKAKGVKGYTESNVRSQVALISSMAEEWARRMTENTGKQHSIDDFFKEFSLRIGDTESSGLDIIEEFVNSNVSTASAANIGEVAGVDDLGRGGFKLGSPNDEWAQEAIAVAGSVEKLKKAVSLAAKGKKLGVAQREAVDIVLAEIQRQNESAVPDTFLGGQDVEFQGKLTEGQKYNQRGELLTNTAEFKEWFGDSRVVDDEGKPLVVYHGTDAEHIDVFDLNKLGYNTIGNANDPAIAATSLVGFWANSGEIKESSNSPYERYEELYFSVSDPVEFDSVDDLAEELRPYLSDDAEMDGDIMKSDISKWVEEKKDEGYDGIIILEDEEFGGTSYVVFDPGQIKSTKNRGTFRLDSKNIYKQTGLTDIPGSDNVIASDKEEKEALGKLSDVFAESGMNTAHLSGIANHLAAREKVFLENGYDPITDTMIEGGQIVIKTMAYKDGKQAFYAERAYDLEPDNKGGANISVELAHVKNYAGKETGLAEKIYESESKEIKNSGFNVWGSMESPRTKELFKRFYGKGPAFEGNEYYHHADFNRTSDSKFSNAGSSYLIFTSEDSRDGTDTQAARDANDTDQAQAISKQDVATGDTGQSGTISKDSAISFQRGRVDQAVKIKEGDVDKVYTGKPVTFNFAHNTDSATRVLGRPKKDSAFGRYFEPSGIYVTITGDIDKNSPKNIVTGILTLNNPLVIENNNLQWKEILSKRYGGKRGKELSKAIINDGYDGVITIEKNYISEIVDFTTFDEAKALYQSDKSSRQYKSDVIQGQILFSGTGRNDATIGLTENANLSTFLHETGHFFLEMVRISNQRHGIYGEEWQTINDFLGAEENKTITTEQHEKWAMAFERYLSEGKAPSIELQGAFEKFKTWLTKIYNQLINKVPLSDEVRNVMDRLLASEQQIKDVRNAEGLMGILDEQALNDIGESGDISEDIGKLFERLGLTEEQARRALDLHRLVGLDERRKEFKAEASEEWNERKSTVYIRTITEIGGLNKEMLVEVYGKDILSSLPKPVGFIKKNTGVSIATAAAELDITKDELISTLQNHMTKSAYIESRVAQLEADHDATLSEQEAVHNESLRIQMAQESALLSKISRKKKVLADRQIRAFARNAVNKMDRRRVRAISKSIGDIRKARLAANKAVKVRDYELALKENERARLAEAILQEQIKAKDKLEVINRRIRRTIKSIKKNPGKYEPGYRDQIIRALLRHSVDGSNSLVQEEDIPLFKFLSDVNDKALNQDDQLIDLTAGTLGAAEWIYREDQIAFKDLTYEQAQDVDDLIRMLAKHGRVDKADILSTGEKISELLPELLEKASDLKKKKKIGKFSMAKGIRQWWRKYKAEQISLQYILMGIDGYDTSGQGINVERLFNPLSEAAGEQHLILKDIREKLAPILAELRDSAEKWPRVLSHIEKPENFKNPENSDIADEWTFDKVLSFALNLGNKDNATKLLDGYGMKYDDALDVISILSEKDLQNIQNLWDVIESLWPKISETHRVINGFSPKKIESQEFVIHGHEEKIIGGVKIPARKPVTLRGGYYPLKFDSGKSISQSKQDDKTDIMESQNAIYPGVKTPQGFTIGRVSSAGGKPVMLSMSVLTDHINHVAHHVTHAIPLSDIDRITRSREYQSTVADVFGKDVAHMIRPALAKVANPRGGSSHLSIDQLLEGERSRAAAYILWYNFRVAAKQPYSLFNLEQAMTGQKGKVGSHAKVSGYIIRAYGDLLKNPAKVFEYREMVHKLSPNMENRAKAIDRELMRPQNFGALRKLSKKETVEQALDSLSDHTGPVLIRVMDFVAAYPGWIAAYNQGIDMFSGNVKRSATYADGIISATQPFDRPLDQSRIRGEKATMARMFTMFSGYTMKFANRRAFYWDGLKQYIASGGKTGISPVEFMSHAIVERIAPSIAMSFMLSYGFEGEPPEAEDILLDMLLFQFAGRYLLQDLASAGAVVFGRTHGFGTSVLNTPLDTGAEIIIDSTKGIAKGWEQGEGTEATISAMAEALGYKYKLPVKRAAENIKKTLEKHE